MTGAHSSEVQRGLFSRSLAKQGEVNHCAIWVQGTPFWLVTRPGIIGPSPRQPFQAAGNHRPRSSPEAVLSHRFSKRTTWRLEIAMGRRVQARDHSAPRDLAL